MRFKHVKISMRGNFNNSCEQMMKLICINGLILFSFLMAPLKLNAQSRYNNSKDDMIVLQSLNAQFIKNFILQDTASHNRIIHKDFVCIQGSGAVTSRDEYMKNWATGYQTGGYTSFEYSDEHIRIFDNVALVRSITNSVKIKDGVTIKTNSLYTDTYIKEDGRWWCIQAQITPVK